MAWKEVEMEDFWHYEEEGDKIKGVLVNIQERKDNVSAIYELETAPEHIVRVWGTTILDRLMEKVKVGQIVRITYKGLKPTKDPRKNDVKIFKVEYWEEETETYDFPEIQVK